VPQGPLQGQLKEQHQARTNRSRQQGGRGSGSIRVQAPVSPLLTLRQQHAPVAAPLPATSCPRGGLSETSSGRGASMGQHATSPWPRPSRLHSPLRPHLPLCHCYHPSHSPAASQYSPTATRAPRPPQRPSSPPPLEYPGHTRHLGLGSHSVYGGDSCGVPACQSSRAQETPTARTAPIPRTVRSLMEDIPAVPHCSASGEVNNSGLSGGRPYPWSCWGRHCSWQRVLSVEAGGVTVAAAPDSPSGSETSWFSRQEEQGLPRRSPRVSL